MESRWLVDESGGKIPYIEQAQSDKVLKLGTCSTSPPCSVLIDNVIEGFEIELIRHFALNNGYRLEIYDMSIGLVVPSLEAGRVDMIAAGLCITESRQQRMIFSDPHQKMAAGVFQVTDHIDDVKQNIFSSIKDSFYNNLIRESRYEQIGEGLMVTIKISLLAILLGSILGCWVYWCASSNHHIVRWCGVGYITLIRGIPVLVLLMLNFYLVFSKSTLPPIVIAVVTFALSFAADIADRLRAILKDKELRNLGQIFTQSRLRNIVPAYKSEAVSLIKSTSIVGYIAMEDVTRVSYVIRSGTFDAFFPLILTAIIYFVLSYLFSLLIDVLISQYKYFYALYK
ncbi:MAG: ABC transporter permease subunit [Rikenellaceae bacterium]